MTHSEKQINKKLEGLKVYMSERIDAWHIKTFPAFDKWFYTKYLKNLRYEHFALRYKQRYGREINYKRWSNLSNSQKFFPVKPVNAKRVLGFIILENNLVLVVKNKCFGYYETCLPYDPKDITISTSK